MSTLVTIQSTDLITNSRADINGNFSALNTDKMETSVLDTDTSLTANSDAKVATQKAVKAYVDAGGNVNASTTVRGIVEEATEAEVLARTEVGATGARLFINPGTLPRRSDRIVYELADSPATWTKDANLLRVRVQAWGGGGSGGASTSNDVSSGGGGGGYREIWIEAASLGSTETVTVGAGGAATSTATNANGSNGGNTTFGSHLTATGGSAGNTSNGANAGGNGGGFIAGLGVSGAAGSNGVDEGGAGGGGTDGEFVTYVGGSALNGGGGGGSAAKSSNFNSGGTSYNGGNGGSGNSGASPATSGSTPAGGGGGVKHTGTVVSGAGGDGRVIVTEYYV